MVEFRKDTGQTGTQINYGGMGVLARFLQSIFWFFLLKSLTGGGKCPEEEHTTCSGGPTIVIVTSAVYGEREIILFHKIKKREK